MPSDEYLHAGAGLNHGRYIIEESLGQGGFGITYLAKDKHSTLRSRQGVLSSRVVRPPSRVDVGKRVD